MIQSFHLLIQHFPQPFAKFSLCKCSALVVIQGYNDSPFTVPLGTIKGHPFIGITLTHQNTKTENLSLLHSQVPLKRHFTVVEGLIICCTCTAVHGNTIWLIPWSKQGQSQCLVQRCFMVTANYACCRIFCRCHGTFWRLPTCEINVWCLKLPVCKSVFNIYAFSMQPCQILQAAHCWR